MLTLYSYWRSSASYRVRIALHYKNIKFETKPIHLLKEGGDQHSPVYSTINPSKSVPTLVVDNQIILTQSLSIIEYLDTLFPAPPLILGNPIDQAYIRSLAMIIACDCSPLNNLKVLKYLTQEFKISEKDKQQWYHRWIADSLSAFEMKLELSAGLFCVGNQVTLADLCLIPQVYNAKRFNIPLDDYPLINYINENCLLLEAFQQALPENQIDAV